MFVFVFFFVFLSGKLLLIYSNHLGKQDIGLDQNLTGVKVEAQKTVMFSEGFCAFDRLLTLEEGL